MPIRPVVPRLPGMLATLVAIAMIAITAPISARAATIIDFTFSFTNDPSNGGGDITGIIRGLEDNMSDQAATSIEILSNTAGFGIGEYIGNPSENNWDVAGGLVTDAFVLVFGVFNTPPAVTDSTLSFGTSASGIVATGVGDRPDEVSENSQGLTTQQFFMPVTPPPAVIPLPATLPLLFGALGALGVAARRRGS